MNEAEARTLGVDEAEEAAYKKSLTTTVVEQTTYLLETVGPRVTAAALNLKDARPLRLWMSGDSGPKTAAVAERLRITFRIVYAVAGVYSGSTAAAFLRSANPQLDDRSPVMLLRQGPLEQVEREVLAATRAFLEG